MFGAENRNTEDEARALKDWAEQNAASVLIVPSEIFAARRVRWIFNREFHVTAVRIEVPSFEEDFARAAWWKTNAGLIAFQTEMLKYIYYRFSKEPMLVEGIGLNFYFHPFAAPRNRARCPCHWRPTCCAGPGCFSAAAIALRIAQPIRLGIDALASVGASFESVVKLNNYIIDTDTNIAHYREVARQARAAE
jgi:hypothetical protein